MLSTHSASLSLSLYLSLGNCLNINYYLKIPKLFIAAVVEFTVATFIKSCNLAVVCEGKKEIKQDRELKIENDKQNQELEQNIVL